MGENDEEEEQEVVDGMLVAESEEKQWVKGDCDWVIHNRPTRASTG